MAEAIKVQISIDEVQKLSKVGTALSKVVSEAIDPAFLKSIAQAASITEKLLGKAIVSSLNNKLMPWLTKHLFNSLRGIQVGLKVANAVEDIGKALENGVAKSILRGLNSRVKPFIQKNLPTWFSVGSSIFSKVGNFMHKINPFGKAPNAPSGGAKSGGKEGLSVRSLRAPLIGIAGGVLGIIANLKPVKTILGAIGSIFSLIFLPLGMIMMAFLAPVLMGLVSILSSKVFQNLLKWSVGFFRFMMKLSPTQILTSIGKFIVSLGLGIIKGFVTIGGSIINGVGKFFMTLINYVINLPSEILKGLMNLGTWIVNGFVTAVSTIVKSLLNAVNPANIGKSIGNFFAGITKLDSGGTIAQTGMALVHKGETVVPSNTNVGGHTFNITVNHSGGMYDPKKVAEDTLREIERKLGRLQRW